MNAKELQDALTNLIDTIAEARDEIEGDDDDIPLADMMRDIASDFEETASGGSYADLGILTTDAGIVLRTAGGDEFQITIVQSKFGTRSGDEDGDEHSDEE